MTDNSEDNNIEKWVLSYSDDMYRWAVYKINEQETAKDLVQETFLAALKSRDKFQGKSQPKTWLFSILNNKIMDYHRNKFRNATMNQSQFNRDLNNVNILDSLFDNEGTWRPDSKPSLWHDLEQHLLDNLEFKQILDFCMKELPENWSSAIQLKYLDERNAKEICQELDITTSNYWQIIHRAKLQLRSCIENNWFK